jgi:hypothetical protein
MVFDFTHYNHKIIAVDINKDKIVLITTAYKIICQAKGWNYSSIFIYHKKFLYNWDRSDLPMTQRLCNAKVHSRTGVSPASLVMPAVNLDRNIIVNININKNQ